MENERIDTPETQETPQPPVYVPRPAWQVWAARIGVIIVFIAFLLYCLQIATGGRI